MVAGVGAGAGACAGAGAGVVLCRTLLCFGLATQLRLPGTQEAKVGTIQGIYGSCSKQTETKRCRFFVEIHDAHGSAASNWQNYLC